MGGEGREGERGGRGERVGGRKKEGGREREGEGGRGREEGERGWERKDMTQPTNTLTNAHPLTVIPSFPLPFP